MIWKPLSEVNHICSLREFVWKKKKAEINKKNIVKQHSGCRVVQSEELHCFYSDTINIIS